MGNWVILENKYLFVGWLIVFSTLLFNGIRTFVESGTSWEFISIIVVILVDFEVAVVWYWGYKNKNKKS